MWQSAEFSSVTEGRMMYRHDSRFSLFQNVHTNSGAHPDSYELGTEEKREMLNTQSDLVTRFRMSGAIHFLPTYALISWKYLYLYQIVVNNYYNIQLKCQSTEYVSVYLHSVNFGSSKPPQRPTMYQIKDHLTLNLRTTREANRLAQISYH